jgi:hypothetical protein
MCGCTYYETQKPRYTQSGATQLPSAKKCGFSRRSETGAIRKKQSREIRSEYRIDYASHEFIPGNHFLAKLYYTVGDSKINIGAKSVKPSNSESLNIATRAKAVH